MKLIGKKIFLRELNPDLDELEDYLSWLRDVESNRFIESARKDYAMEDLVAYINDKNDSPTAILFGIFNRQTSTLIGTVKLEPIDRDKKIVWVGILIGNSSNHGKGYGFEALDILCKFCNSILKLEKIFLGVSPNNFPAVRLYKKFGFLPYVNQRNVMYLDIEEYNSKL